MASKNRKTKVLSYNLHDRCRKFTGVDRSNVDVDAMVNLINSDHVQEMVATNSLQGFYGHQIRQRYGMVPPETVIIKGKVVYLSRAFKTIELRASRMEQLNTEKSFMITSLVRSHYKIIKPKRVVLAHQSITRMSVAV